MLTQLGTNIWYADGGIVSFHGAAYPTRMAIVRLADGGLWAWSPIALTSELEGHVRALGPVRHIVSPNRLHFLFLAHWHRIFPDATLWGTAATIRHCDDLPFGQPLSGRPPTAWAGQIDQFYFDNSLMMEELIFFHRPSRTAIIADLSQPFSQNFIDTHWPWWLRLVARWSKMVEGVGHPPFDYRWSFRRRAEARPKIRSLIDAGPTNVIVAHGEVVCCDGARFLSRAFSWLL